MPHATPHHRPDTMDGYRRAAERVILAMHEQLDTPMTLDQMAHIAFMSPFHFNRTFRQVTGAPPRLFLSAVRLATARRLLVTTTQSVTDVCFSVGYNSFGTFVRRFSSLLGISPGRLRLLAASDGVTPDAPPSVDVPVVERSLLTGHVEAPPDFAGGMVFVGLFRTPIPQETPVACAVLRSPGPYTLKAPPGDYYLFAVALPRVRDWACGLLYESALRAGGQLLRIGTSEIHGETSLTLRAPLSTDPPILWAVPLLLARRVGAIEGPPAEPFRRAG